MTLAFPTHVADTMSSATAIGVEAASHLLHDVGHAVSTAAVSTSGRVRRMARTVRRSRQPRSSTNRNRMVFGAVAAVALGAAMVRRLRLGYVPCACATSAGLGRSGDGARPSRHSGCFGSTGSRTSRSTPSASATNPDAWSRIFSPRQSGSARVGRRRHSTLQRGRRAVAQNVFATAVKSQRQSTQPPPRIVFSNALFPSPWHSEHGTRRV